MASLEPDAQISKHGLLSSSLGWKRWYKWGTTLRRKGIYLFHRPLEDLATYAPMRRFNLEN